MMVIDSCRCNLVVLHLAALSAGEVQLSEHDHDQGGTECEVEGVELDRDGHGCLMELMLEESREVKCLLTFLGCLCGWVECRLPLCLQRLVVIVQSVKSRKSTKSTQRMTGAWQRRAGRAGRALVCRVASG